MSYKLDHPLKVKAKGTGCQSITDVLPKRIIMDLAQDFKVDQKRDSKNTAAELLVTAVALDL